ncbi:MAG: helix-turn-helix domain-containing protein [Armatimonadetes bacterium]|nr:helix-turn-helix domain-containing protein [Armatimonadota bacterium]MBS1727773.1 helix-turn-helix domain-containing protein [Armatimonadota bacterium]
MPYHISDLSAAESVAIFRALASESRARIMEMLGERDMNINELSVALGLAQPSITKHIQILEEAGLVISDYLSGAQGMQKRCRKVHDRLIVDMSGKAKEKDYVIEIEVPVGMYTKAEVVPTCGLATRDRLVGVIDDPLAFSFPDRARAEILWSGGGFVEYKFPNSLPVTSFIESIEFIAEVASEAPGYANDYPSDITIWINDVEVGTWISPGDPGGEKGRLNPSWWADYMNQHGFLKAWRINNEGTYVDDQKLSNVSIADLNVQPWQATRIRIGIKPEDANQGGFTLFGKGFGSFEQDLLLRIHHSTRGGDLPENVKKPPAK